MTTRTPVMRPLRSSRQGSPLSSPAPGGIGTESHDVLSPARVPTLNGEQPYPAGPTSAQDVMTDIEVPNTAVDMNS